MVTPFKVIQGTNRKLICDFLLVININLPPILHRFEVLIIGQIFAVNVMYKLDSLA